MVAALSSTASLIIIGLPCVTIPASNVVVEPRPLNVTEALSLPVICPVTFIDPPKGVRMVTGSTKVDDPITIVCVPVARPMVIPVKPSANAAISVSLISKVPIPRAGEPTSMDTLSAEGCNNIVLEPDMLPATPIKSISSAVMTMAPVEAKSWFTVTAVAFKSAEPTDTVLPAKVVAPVAALVWVKAPVMAIDPLKFVIPALVTVTVVRPVVSAKSTAP